MEKKLLPLIPFFPLVILLSACSTSSITMDVLVPGEIAVPSRIKNIGILNRSLPADESKFANFMEGFLTGETIHGDREASRQCMQGLTEVVNQSPRFNAVMIEGVDLRGTGIRQFPPPLSWEQVNDLCQRFRVDAIFALEVFDSNIRLEQGEREVERKEKDKKVKVKEFWNNLYIDVNSGWKGYDPVRNTFIDMQIYTDGKSWSGVGVSPQQALSQLPPKRRAINDAAYFAGMQYAHRISPTWLTVSRQYYKKGHPLLEEGCRYVKTGDWADAAQTWQILLNNDDPKIAGQAAYNLALAAEMDGDLASAADWARESYHKYGNKKALNYLRTIEKRIADQERLREQME